MTQGHRRNYTTLTDATLNERQRWVLDRVGKGHPVKAREIAAHWQVSIKSARRDLAGLCGCGLLRFVGARKNGRYQLAHS